MPRKLNDFDKEILTVRRGAQVNFEFHPDKSIGMMDHSAVNPSGNRDALDVYRDPKAWSAFLWDSQFTRYLQILDTDDEHNYIILYQCFETAVFHDKAGKELKAREAFNQSTREYLDISKRPIVKYNYGSSMIA